MSVCVDGLACRTVAALVHSCSSHRSVRSCSAHICSSFRRRCFPIRVETATDHSWGSWRDCVLCGVTHSLPGEHTTTLLLPGLTVRPFYCSLVMCLCWKQNSHSGLLPKHVAHMEFVFFFFEVVTQLLKEVTCL